MELKLTYVGNKDGLTKYLEGIRVCERCGSFDGVTHSTVDEARDKIYYWSMCDICQDDFEK